MNFVKIKKKTSSKLIMKDLRNIITINYWKNLLADKSPRITTLHYDFTIKNQPVESKIKKSKKKNVAKHFTF